MRKLLLVLKYFVYFCFTIEKRNRYMMAKSRGMDCYHSEDGKGLLGQSTDYYYRHGEPKRDYVTFREFMQSHNKCK